MEGVIVMKSAELWNKLKKSNKIVKNNNIFYIFPKEIIKIKNFGIIKFLKKENEKVIIECNETKNLKTTIDHIFTNVKNIDIVAENLNYGDSIFGGEKGDKVFTVSAKKKFVNENFSYDVTTETEHFMVNNLYSHNCRSWLTALWVEKTYPINTPFHWQIIDFGNEKYEGACGHNFDYSRGFGEFSALPYRNDIVINFRGNSGWVKEFNHENKTVTILQPRVYGRWNNGVVTIDIPMYAGEARLKVNKRHEVDSSEYVENYKEEYISQFYKDFDEGLELCHQALKIRNDSCSKIQAKNSPLLWMHGAYLRESDPEKTLGQMMQEHKYWNTISLGYVGLYETCMALLNKSNTTDEGQELSVNIMKLMNDKTAEWKEKDAENNGTFNPTVYGTPEEQLTHKFALALKKHLGVMNGVTDHDYVTNSYHVNPAEQISWKDKLNIEGKYLSYTKGGAVSYIETDNLKKNPEVIESVIQFMNDSIAYSEVNTTLGNCFECGYQGDFYLKSNDKHDKYYFECPKCHNINQKKMDITMRLCGYIGKVNCGETTHGRMSDFADRQKVRHIKIAS